ncbi:MAG: hypothetical protein N3A72_08385, partial [bacterium]|nr:hypothetical protein [bacterium]
YKRQILLGLLLTKLENEFASGTVAYHNLQALNLAEAGIEKAIFELTRTNGVYSGEKNTQLGNGFFSVTVKPTQNGFLITAMGKTRSAAKYSGHRVISVQVQRQSANHWKVLSWEEN